MITLDLYTPKLSIVSEEYGAANVTIIVEWTHLVDAAAVYYHYEANILPSSAFITIIKSTNSCRLTIPYNSDYNLSVKVSVLQCRPEFSTTTFISLNYGE